MAIGPSLDFIPEALRGQDIYPKVCGMIDHIVQNFEAQLQDTKYKFRGAPFVRQEVIEQIISELGFSYIKDVMGTITNFQFNQLVQFLGLINLLKGSRQGLELVLKLLGFDSIITEWWESNPKGEVDTFNLVVIANSSNVPDLNATVDKVKIFVRNYVYPILNIVDFRFNFALPNKNVTMAGFVKLDYTGIILQRI